MSASSTDPIEQIRAQARAIADRARSDPAFEAQLRADPVATLSAAGLPEPAIGDLLREDGYGEVAGYLKCTYTCNANPGDPRSCLFTDCWITNW